MMSKLLSWFKGDEKLEESEQSPERAAAALLIEVALADDNFSEDEKEAIPSLLRQHSKLNAEEAIELLEIAQEDVDNSIALHEFTHYLNEQFSLEEKLELITNMWRVAYADQQIDKYEESIIRKVADLLHLRHSEYIKCKHHAMN